MSLKKANNHRSIFLTLLLTLSCSACSWQKPKHGNNTKQILRLSHLGNDPKTFNPWTSNDATSSRYASLLFASLFTNNPDTDEIEEHFAQSYEIKKGGKLVLVKLRDDIFWTDGKAITAHDVEFTWNTLIRDGVAQSSLKDILTVDGKFPKVKALNTHEVSFELEEVFAPFLKSIGIAIAPKHDIEKFFTQQKAETFEQKQKAFNSYLNIFTKPNQIISSGAFKLKKLVSGERIEFTRNDTYFRKDAAGKQLPYLDEIVYSYIQDQSAGIFKFIAGEVDTLSVTPRNAALIKELESNHDFQLYELGPTSSTSFIWFNMSKNIPEPKYSWFNDKNFRQAISFTLNRKAMVENVYQGIASPLFTPESLICPFINQEIAKGFEQDLAKALDLLKESGFKQVINKDGKKILLDAKDNKVEFNLITNSGNKERELMSAVIIDNLKELGIKVNFKLLEFNNFVGRVTQAKDYEAGVMGFTGGNEPHFGANVWNSSGRLHAFDPKHGQEGAITRKWEKEIDLLFKQGVRTVDFKERKKIYDKYQEIVAEQNPFIYLVSPNSLSAISKRLGGIRKTKYGGMIPRLDEVFIKATK